MENLDGPHGIPGPDAPWYPSIVEYALTFEGYEGFAGRLMAAAPAAYGAWKDERIVTSDLRTLRSFLYFEQRAQWRREESGGSSTPEPVRLEYAQALLAGIRSEAQRRRALPAKRRAVEALKDSMSFRVRCDLDKDGCAPDVNESLLGTIDAETVEVALGDVTQGSGGELTGDGKHRPKFHSAYSSCALAVNAFAPWRLDPSSLELVDRSGFESLRFEVKCPIFASRATPPNLDVLLQTGNGTTVGVESKLTEYLAGKQTAQFAEVYKKAVAELLDEEWTKVYELLVAQPNQYRYLNAAQLTKHALGLRRCHGDDELVLLYVYWEPKNAQELDAFAQHRSEIDDLSERTAGSSLQFASISYPELWQVWTDHANDAELKHIAALRARYYVFI